MVKITDKYLLRKILQKPQILSKKKGETDNQYLNRVTHLHLQSQFVDQIDLTTDCNSVTVIYLQNNHLQTIHSMENFPNLTHLYLQKNHISKIENVNFLKHLKKLYLGSNEISVLEGLDELENLIELHIESQRLPEGETIFFDPRTVKNLARTLKVLNISRNNISSLQGLSGMTQLEELIANDNKIENVDDIADTLSTLPRLKALELTGNPITKNRKYREVITLSSNSLTMLDDKPITPEARTFVENLAVNRKTRQITKSSSDQQQQRKIPQMMSGSKLFPLLKMRMAMPRTVSTFSATVPPHYFHQSLRTFQFGSHRPGF